MLLLLADLPALALSTCVSCTQDMRLMWWTCACKASLLPCAHPFRLFLVCSCWVLRMLCTSLHTTSGPNFRVDPVSHVVVFESADACLHTTLVAGCVWIAEPRVEHISGAHLHLTNCSSIPRTSLAPLALACMQPWTTDEDNSAHLVLLAAWPAILGCTQQHQQQQLRR